MFQSNTKGQQHNDIIHIVDENLRQGFAQVPRPVLRAKRLSLKAKVVYIALLDYAWRNDSCFPGHQTLADDLDTSRDSVIRALDELRCYGLIDWKRQGLNRPNVYYLLRLSDCANLTVGTAPASKSKRKSQSATSRNRNLPLQEVANSNTNNTQYKEYPSKNTHISKISNSSRTKKGSADPNVQTTGTHQQAHYPTGGDASEEELPPRILRDETPEVGRPTPSNGFAAIAHVLENRPSVDRGSDSDGVSELESISVLPESEPLATDHSDGADEISRPLRTSRLAAKSETPQLDAAVDNISSKAGDWKHRRSNLTQARNMVEQYGISEQMVAEILHQSYSRSKEANPRNRMAWIFKTAHNALTTRPKKKDLAGKYAALVRS